MTRWLEGVAICMQGTQTFWIERQPGPTEHQQKTLGKHSPTPELRANPEQGQAVLPDEVQCSHLCDCLNISGWIQEKESLGWSILSFDNQGAWHLFSSTCHLLFWVRIWSLLLERRLHDAKRVSHSPPGPCCLLPGTHLARHKY